MPLTRTTAASSFKDATAMTIEETYELSDAILHNDIPNTEKELGDVMLHIVFYCKIASEKGDYDIADMINKLCDKLVYRHPHVYGTVKADTAEQVVQNWEQLKVKEKDGNKTVLAGVPEAMPPLIKAYRMITTANKYGGKVNTPGNDDSVDISPDGDFLFLYRQNDIYWTETKKILKPILTTY